MARVWNHESSIEWHVTQEPRHAGVQHWVKDLNHLYQSQPAMHERDFSPDGLQWHHQPYSLRLTLPPLSASLFLSPGGVALL